MQLNKAEKAWKPSPKKPTTYHEDLVGEDDPEQVKSQQLLKRLRSILNKLTPEKFQELTKQVKELTIDTEERLKGAIDLIFEKAILEPNFCVAYANMCRCLRGVSCLFFFFFLTLTKCLLKKMAKDFCNTTHETCCILFHKSISASPLSYIYIFLSIFSSSS